MIELINSLAGRTFFLIFFGVLAAVMLTLHLAAATHGVPAGRPLLLLLTFAVFVSLLAYGIARMSTRPLSNLASAAQRLGGNIDAAPLAERGPVEVRKAAGAFNAMQARIRRGVQERSYMLAAITHDLQTPVTRLRLRLEKVQDEALRERLIADLASMSVTIGEGLDLARSLDSREALTPVDLDSVLDSVCADAQEAKHDVTLTGKTGAAVLAAPNSLGRCITNLIDHALTYGRYARIEARAEAGCAIVTVRDGGPGIPDAQLEAVFDPFYRLESSRSRETGGSGIGLTIARNIAHRYGGTLVLHNHPEGGLEAVLTFPV